MNRIAIRHQFKIRYEYIVLDYPEHILIKVYFSL